MTCHFVRQNFHFVRRNFFFVRQNFFFVRRNFRFVRQIGLSVPCNPRRHYGSCPTRLRLTPNEITARFSLHCQKQMGAENVIIFSDPPSLHQNLFSKNDHSEPSPHVARGQSLDIAIGLPSSVFGRFYLYCLRKVL